MSERAVLPEPLQRIVLAAQQASPTIRLAGGSGLALILGHRCSDDLDLFGAVREDIEPVVRAIEETAKALGTEGHRVRTGPGFVRLEIPQWNEIVRIDAASDTAARLVADDTYVGSIRVESLRDLHLPPHERVVGQRGTRELTCTVAVKGDFRVCS
jgi:hypothetical protein